MTGPRPGRGVAFIVALGLASLAACSGSGDGAERADESDPTSTTSDVDSADTTTSAAVVEVDLDVDEDRALRLGLSGLESLDPIASTPASVSGVMLADLLYDSLTAIDDAGAVTADIASFSANADATVWRFSLDQGATFADGAAITADDVVFSLERVLSGGRGSLAALRLDGVASISITAGTMVDIALSEPSAVLPEVLSSPSFAITSRAAIERANDGGDITPNGSGDYAVAFDGERRLVLERRKGEGPQSVVVDLLEDEDTALDAFLDGDVDWTIAPPGRLSEGTAIVGDAGLVPFHGGLFLGVDAGVPPLEDPGLRRAIALGIDREALVDAVFGPTAIPAAGVVPQGAPGGGDECRGVCGPVRDEASALVKAAFPDGQSTPLRLLVDNSAALRSLGGAIERQLEDVGLDVEVVSLPVPTYEDLIATGQQQLFVFGWLGVARSPADHLAPLFLSSSPDNVTGLADPGVDNALRAALVEPIASVRAAAWRNVEKTILDLVPVVPLVQYRTTGVLAPRVQGFVVRADGSVDLSGVTIDG